MPVSHDDLYAQSWNTNFGPIPFEDKPPGYTQNTDDNDYVPIEAPKYNHPPSPETSKHSGKYTGNTNPKSPIKLQKYSSQEDSINTPGENTIYVLIPIQTTLTHIDTKKTDKRKLLISLLWGLCFFLLLLFSEIHIYCSSKHIQQQQNNKSNKTYKIRNRYLIQRTNEKSNNCSEL